MYTELTNKEVTTRKDHRCVWCGETINKGEKAQYRVYIFDDFQHDYMHPECYVAMVDSSTDLHLDEGFLDGEFKRGLGELKWD